MPTVRVGVIGVGHLGYHHARIYAAMEGVELAGVADVDESRRRKAADDFHTRPCASSEELFELGIDAVSVVTPTNHHCETTLQALKSGIDVFVEKAIVTAAGGANRVLQVGHIERFNGAVIALMGAVRNPRFIECHRLSPYPNRGDDVSVVLDLMIHDLDIVRALVGAEITSIDAVGVPVFSPFEDIANARLRFATGCVANVTASRVSVERMRKIRIFAEDIYVSTDYSAQEVMMYRKKPGALGEGMTPMDLISVDPLPVLREEPLKLELESFVNCVRSRTRPVVSGEDALAALRLALRIVDAIRSGP
jgi:predicted dehydrogenase